MLALVAVQNDSGRELVAWKGEVSDIAKIEAEVSGDRLSLYYSDEQVAEVPLSSEHRGLHLLVWDAGDKLAAPLRDESVTEVVEGEVVEDIKTLDE